MVTHARQANPPHNEEWRSWKNYDLREGWVAKGVEPL
jgi:hypothetical protein